MNSAKRAVYDQMKREIRKAEDCLGRALDGATECHWECQRLGYCQTQLLKANKYLIMAIELINAEVNGKREGEPVDAKPDEVMDCDPQ